MQRYYSPIWDNQQVFYLSEEESRHCISIMRNQVGDRISILDGKGNSILAEIISANPKKMGVKYIEHLISEVSPPYRNLHIAISPTKSNDRIEWFIEKACEIGVGQITPLICKRTERSKVNLERWRKIVIASCKQSSLHYFPEINEEIKLEKFIEKNKGKEAIYIASIESKQSLERAECTQEIIILIGPEGDFSEEEFNIIRSSNVKEISLSNHILRVETAGIVAVCQWNQVNIKA